MDFPFPNNAPAGDNAGAATDDFWAFNPQQPPPLNNQADDTSLDELLALYQTANDAPPAPFAPMGEPESYPFDPAAAGGDAGGFPDFGAAGAAFGDPATDAPFPAFGAEGDFGLDASAPAFGGDAPAFPPFDAGAGGFPAMDAAPGGDFGAFDSSVPPLGDAGGFPAFDSSVPPLGDAGGFPAFDAAPGTEAPGGFDMGGMNFDAPAADGGFGGFESVVPEAAPGDFGAFDSSVPPLGDAGGFPAFDAAPGMEATTDFGDLGDLSGGPVFEAFDPTAAAPEAGAMEFPAFGDDAPMFPAFDAGDDGLAELGDLSGGPVFEAFDPTAAAAPVTEFPAFDAPAAETPMEFPAFGEDAGPVFEAFDAPGATTEEPMFGAFTSDDEGPLFPPLEAPAAEPAPAPAAAAPVADSTPLVFGEEELEEFVPDEDAPLFPAVADAPVFPAFEAAGAAFEEAPAPVAEAPVAEPDAFAFPAFEETPAEDMSFPPLGDGPVFEAFDATPVDATPVTEFPAFETPVVAEPVAVTPEPPIASVAPGIPSGDSVIVPSVDPEQTLRYREVSAPESVPTTTYDAGALAAMTGQQVVVKTADDRRAANQQLTQVVGALSTGLDEIQGRMAHLYADLQKAAVSRAPVDEIQRITTDLAKAKSSVGEDSELYKQALYMRQMADAYLQMLKEL